jgi:serine/threonine-protein kinase
VIGETIKGVYRIYEVVSKEPLINVYLGRNLQTNEIVAVEIISKRIFDEVLGITRNEWNRRFRRDLDSLARAMSPHIARIYDYGEWGDSIFVVSEYVPGKSLKQVIEERGALNVEEALDIGRQIADCLAVLQSEKLSHGDLRPANVMISVGGLVKILEIGVSKSFIVEGLMPRAIVEMPSYVAPEQGEGETPDIRSDIYAVGVLLFEMLTGKLPFTSDDPARLLLRHITEPAPSARALRPELPAEVEAIINRCLAKRPNDRFQTPIELIAAITAVLRGAEPEIAAVAKEAVKEKEAVAPPPAFVPPAADQTVVPPAPPPPATTPFFIETAPEPVPVSPPQRRKLSPILLAAAGVAAVALIAVLAIVLFGGGKQAEIGGVSGPTATAMAALSAGTTTAAVAPGGTVSPTVPAATGTPVVAKTASPAAPTLTAAAKAAGPTITATPTRTRTPTSRRGYLPLILKKKSRS